MVTVPLESLRLKVTGAEISRAVMEVISCLQGPQRDAGRVGVDCGQHVLLDIALPSDLVTLQTPGDEGKGHVAGEPLLLLCGGDQLAWEPEQFEVARSVSSKGQGYGGGHGQMLVLYM